MTARREAPRMVRRLLDDISKREEDRVALLNALRDICDADTLADAKARARKQLHEVGVFVA